MSFISHAISYALLVLYVITGFKRSCPLTRKEPRVTVRYPKVKSAKDDA